MTSNGHVDLRKLPIEKRVRALWLALGWTQPKIAEEVGVSARQVKRWCAGTIPSEASAIELARIAPREMKATPDLFFEPVERREERLLELETKVAQLGRRLARLERRR